MVFAREAKNNGSVDNMLEPLAKAKDVTDTDAKLPLAFESITCMSLTLIPLRTIKFLLFVDKVHSPLEFLF